MSLIKILCVTAALLVLFANATESRADQCFRYTEEQTEVLKDAYAFAESSGYGYTLAGLVAHEGFFGGHVLRYNPNDLARKYEDRKTPPRGSYGTTQILLSTAMPFYGLDPDSWRDVIVAYSVIVPDLTETDNLKSWNLSLQLLERHRKRLFGSGRALTTRDWNLLWGSWNSIHNTPDSDYTKAVASKIRNFIACDFFRDVKKELKQLRYDDHPSSVAKR